MPSPLTRPETVPRTGGSRAIAKQGSPDAPFIDPTVARHYCLRSRQGGVPSRECRRRLRRPSATVPQACHTGDFASWGGYKRRVIEAYQKPASRSPEGPAFRQGGEQVDMGESKWDIAPMCNI